jgi:hypothetical protein
MEPPNREHRRGRYPRNVVSLRVVRQQRRFFAMQMDLLDQDLAKAESTVASAQAYLEHARGQLQQIHQARRELLQWKR